MLIKSYLASRGKRALEVSKPEMCDCFFFPSHISFEESLRVPHPYIVEGISCLCAPCETSVSGREQHES